MTHAPVCHYKAIEALAQDYHNAINEYWHKEFGGRNVTWDMLPESSRNLACSASRTQNENKEAILSWMTIAVVELNKAGFEIREI
jgi:hypothetical protein